MKNIAKLLIPALAFAACSQPVPQVSSENEFYLLIGSANPAQEESIQLYSFNQETGDFAYVNGATGVDNPTFMCTNSQESIVYAVGEFDEPEKATMNALTLNKIDGKMELFSSLHNNAGAPCNIILTPNEDYLLSANYWGGSMTSYAIAEDGALQNPAEIKYEGFGPHVNQTQPHIHAVNFTPDNKYVLLNDLGLDCIHVYPLNDRTESDSVPLFDVEKGYDVEVDKGAGPRHLCWTPNGKYAYVISELSGQLFTLSYSEEKLEVINSIIADTIQGGGSADIHITKDGKFLYASHRLKGDGISIYSVDATTGDLTRLGYQLTGVHPRNFTLTPNDKFLLVACRDTNEIQVFERDPETGMLKDTGKKIELNKPMFVKFLKK